jgi:hypothetical protein
VTPPSSITSATTLAGAVVVASSTSLPVFASLTIVGSIATQGILNISAQGSVTTTTNATFEASSSLIIQQSSSSSSSFVNAPIVTIQAGAKLVIMANKPGVVNGLN